MGTLIGHSRPRPLAEIAIKEPHLVMRLAPARHRTVPSTAGILEPIRFVERQKGRTSFHLQQFVCKIIWYLMT